MDVFHCPRCIDVTNKRPLDGGKDGGDFFQKFALFKIIQSFSSTGGDPFEPDVKTGLKEQDKVRFGGKIILSKDDFRIEPQGTLIGGCGKIIAVAEDDLALHKTRQEKVLYMLPAVGKEEFKFFFAAEPASVPVQLANFHAIRPIGRLLGDDYRISFGQQITAKEISLGGFSGSIGGMIFPIVAGMVLDANPTGGYAILFSFCAFAYVLAYAIHHALVPRLEMAEV